MGTDTGEKYDPLEWQRGSWGWYIPVTPNNGSAHFHFWFKHKTKFSNLLHSHHTGQVKRPSGKTDIPNITENKDGTITVKYAPSETGLHELSIKYDDQHVPGKLFWYSYLDSIPHLTMMGVIAKREMVFSK